MGFGRYFNCDNLFWVIILVFAGPNEFEAALCPNKFEPTNQHAADIPCKWFVPVGSNLFGPTHASHQTVFYYNHSRVMLVNCMLVYSSTIASTRLDCLSR